MTREKAIKMLKSKMDGHTDTSYEWAETVRMAIKALDQTRWIPVNERLPGEPGTYMTTVDYGKYGLAVGQIYYYARGLWDNDCVVAWMPLPEPYKEVEE